MKLNCIIVDDEPLAQDVLESYVKRVPTLELKAKCNNAVEAFEVLHVNPIDIIFLDIQMPEITGVEFLKSLKNPPAVIFTTAYSEYAVDGYELDVVDYLLKPIAFDRFLKAVNKVIDQKLPGKAEKPATPDGQIEDYIFIKTDKKIVRVNYQDIHYIEGLKDYVMINTADKRYVTLMTMKALEEALPSSMFRRVHKSYIVSLDKVKAIMGNAIEIKDKLIPIGKMYKEDFFKLIEKHNLIK